MNIVVHLINILSATLFQMLSRALPSAFRMSRLAGCQTVLIGGGGVRPISTERPLEKTNWKHDTVYLYQFPRTPYLANMSPYCLKLETFIRVNNIKHEVISTITKRSSKGKLPFIELNGQQTADSQLIIWRLQKEMGIKDPIDGYDRGVARALDRMFDASTHFALMQDKVVNNSRSLLSRNISGAPAPAIVTNFLAGRFKKTAQSMISRRLDRLQPDEIKEVLKRDIQAVNDILGEKKFLFGDRMTITDCTVFGHLACCYYLPYRQQITDLLDDEYPNIRNYLDRIRSHYFQDWKIKDY